MTLADVVRRLEDCLVVLDREVTPTGGETTRAKLIALLLDVSRAELAGRRPSEE